MYRYYGIVRGFTGPGLASTSVDVATNAAGTVAASLYDSAGAGIANPTTTNSRGAVDVYSPAAQLWYRVAGDTVWQPLPMYTWGPGFTNVMDYGATGDGTTDDTVALQAAFDACPPGGRLYAPTGVYRCTNLVITNQVSLFGDGRRATIFKTAAPSGSAMQWRAGAANNQYVRLQDWSLYSAGGGEACDVGVDIATDPGVSTTGGFIVDGVNVNYGLQNPSCIGVQVEDCNTLNIVNSAFAAPGCGLRLRTTNEAVGMVHASGSGFGNNLYSLTGLILDNSAGKAFDSLKLSGCFVGGTDSCVDIIEGDTTTGAISGVVIEATHLEMRGNTAGSSVCRVSAHDGQGVTNVKLSHCYANLAGQTAMRSLVQFINLDTPSAGPKFQMWELADLSILGLPSAGYVLHAGSSLARFSGCQIRDLKLIAGTTPTLADCALFTDTAAHHGGWTLENILYQAGGATTDGFTDLQGALRISGKRVVFESAAPTTRTWAAGDICFNSAPAAAGKVGWACVTAGTPGTWKAFGVIDA